MIAAGQQNPLSGIPKRSSSLDAIPRRSPVQRGRNDTIVPKISAGGVNIVNLPQRSREIIVEESAKDRAKKQSDIQRAQDIISKSSNIPDISIASLDDIIETFGSVDNAEKYIQLSTNLENLQDKFSTKKALKDGVELLIDQASKIPSSENPIGSFGVEALNEVKESMRYLPEKRGFENSVNLLRSLLTRASGQVGVLTKEDVQAVLPSILDLGSSFGPQREIAKKGLAFFLKSKFGEQFIPDSLKRYSKKQKNGSSQLREKSTEELLNMLGQ
ncbi:MAG: hypothetical protein KC589_07705 [Nanoarchaeota archaeon]|nr:hypothetical protein [Nanoarchaeota archaeon]